MPAPNPKTRLRVLLGILAASLGVSTALIVLGADPDVPQPPPPPSEVVGASVRLTRVVDVGEPITDLQHAGDGSGRLFVAEKQGRIRVVRDGSLLDAPYFDIEERVASASSERGLLGFAFAPDFATSGRLYVNYSGEHGQTVIARFTAADPSADTLDPATEEILLEIDQPYSNHNAGQLRFGPDGLLWIGTGDGGAGGDPEDRAENPDALLGKMLRLDVDDPNAEPEIWAIGLRNPWRYAFDPETDELWIADVGQNAWEEINRVAADAGPGLHFGWDTMEGTHCFEPAEGCDTSGKVMPVYEYPHSDGCSVTGGVVYRGAALPALDGVYLLTDYCTGWLRGLRPGQDGAVVAETILESTDMNISSFGEDEAGEVYVLALPGVVYRLEAVE